MSKNPTAWTYNWTAPTTNVIQYDLSTEPYDNSAQPYDGYPAGVSPNSIKTPTVWTTLSGVGSLYQQYYGGPTDVPLWAAPTHWSYNWGLQYQDNYYNTTLGAEADLDIYDNSTDSYDGSNSAVSPNYDSTNNGESFFSRKHPTVWTEVTGGSF